MKNAAPPNRRRMLWALAALGMLLIPAVHFYRADRALPDAGKAAAPATSAAAGEAMTTAVPPVEARREPEVRPGVDASVFYKNDFALYAALTDEEKQMFRQPLAELDPDTAAALFKKIQPILDLLQQATAADYCEWGLGEMTYDSATPQVGKAQEIGTLVRWSAGYRFPSDPQGALGDLRAQARLGDHVADSMIGWLIQISMERGANKILEQNAVNLDEAGEQLARELLRSSTIKQNTARAFASQSAVMESMAKALAAQRTPAERMKVLVAAFGTSGASEEPALQRLVQDANALAAEVRYIQQIVQHRLRRQSARSRRAGADRWHGAHRRSAHPHRHPRGL